MLTKVIGTFQSLFSWMLLWKSPSLHLTSYQSYAFQSLFSWMLLWKLVCRVCADVCNWFQSLFSWMLLWKFLRPMLSCLYLPRFNPCSLGCCSESFFERCKNQRWNKVSILVLLDVALKVGDIGDQEFWFWSFNPCSLGCCSERTGSCSSEFAVSSFNPCSLGCCSERQNGAVIWCDERSFNPCSLGCCSESLPLHPGKTWTQ